MNVQQDLDYQIKFQTLLSNIKVNQTNANEKIKDQIKKKENLLQSEDASNIFVQIDDKIYQIKLFKLSKKHSLSYENENMPSILFLIKEAAIQSSRSKDENSKKYQTQMIAQVSHELRTPLNCIMLMLEQLQQKINQELNKKYLRPSINSCNLLLSLINDILDLAQINAGKFTFIFQKFRLSKLLKETIKLLKQKAQLKGIDMILDYDKSIPRYIISDPNRLRQILINLIGNSLKFTRKGSITLKTTLINTQPVRMDIQVIDTGIGIPQEKQEEIFNQFNKIQDNQNKQLNSSGCGLGLNISNQLAKGISINGQGIRVQSQVGQGSTFSFYLEDKQILKQTENYIGYYKKDRSNPKQSKQNSKKDEKQRKRSKSRSMISQKQICQQNGQILPNQNISKFCIQQERNFVESNIQKRGQKFTNNPSKGVPNISGGNIRKISSDLGVDTRTNISYKKEEMCSSSSLKQISTSNKYLQEENQKKKNSSQNIKNDSSSLSSSSYSSSQSSPESQKSQCVNKDICRKSSRQSQIKSEQREKKCSIFDYMTNLSYNSIRFDQLSNLDKTHKTNSQQKLGSLPDTSNNNISNNRKFSQLSAIVQSQQQLQQAKPQIKKTHRVQNRFNTQIMISKLHQFDFQKRNEIIVQELTNFQDQQQQQINQTNNSTFDQMKNCIEDEKNQNASIQEISQLENYDEEFIVEINQKLSESTINSDIYQKDFATQQSQQNFERKSSFYKRSFSNEISQIKSRSNKDMLSDYRKKTHIGKKDTINMIKHFYENIQNTCDCFRILIVDDNQFNVQALKLFLSTYFYSSIDVAFDGEQAIEKVQNYLNLNSECGCREYDLIFMDIEMPLLDGFQTSIQIHKILSDKINNPKTVIIASSANDEYQESNLKKYKIDYQIEKPVKKKQLEQVLIKWANDIKFLLAITSSLRNIEFN
ncbi:ATPase, histidine kinase-, DNA gyrase B (macronuclear) [Tetrahymena thermophila SB210]|uniref:ATPase, histidine kinase-, DNA gyrase B n=1 Tax=Tetrahymena thermophila (strain SB210) TaxID=312017 RepID=Q24IJ4_TETTS|nr:ATPase, histidine kinase-, DNA gyrase B [Tetrahymena thermophila SB210]EAS07631.3 ATPase, histidine kinase-, DNA gyrase B [Tetrahymena thermophila SB210]|eukprot:XP_001027873.3 ATPase, histidine kinase-, DNA gyrase B [Tetrahymena thermophila SB210]